MVRETALLVGYDVHESGRREVIGLDFGEVEPEAEWRALLRIRERGRDRRRVPSGVDSAACAAALHRVAWFGSRARVTHR